MVFEAKSSLEVSANIGECVTELFALFEPLVLFIFHYD